MNKMIAVGVLLAAALAMVGCETVSDGNVPDVLTAIATRKSIRKFDPLRAVEDEKVEKILRAAMCAPSAMDRRFSWRRPHRGGARDSGDSRWLRAAQHYPDQLSGGRSGGEEQVEPRENSRRPLVRCEGQNDIIAA